MKARKENKVYTIETESEKQRYLKAGYDIYDENGKIVAYSPLKKVAYSEYARLEAENKILHERIAELEAEQTVRTEAVAEEAQQEEKTTKKAGSKKAGE